jgi:hypothetical protein
MLSIAINLTAEVEHEPAQLVAEALIVQDEVADFCWELRPLPTAFGSRGIF